MILWFLRSNITLGIPTPHFSDEEGQSLHTIQDNMAVNNNLYVVVHTASDYVSIEWFQQEFVTSFTLGDISNCVYIIKVEAIYGLLFVFQNYGSAGDDQNKLFCALPKIRMGKILWWQDSFKLLTQNAWCYPIIGLFEIFSNRTSWFIIILCTPIFDMHILWWLGNVPRWKDAIPTSNPLKCGSKTTYLPQWIFSQGIDILRFIKQKPYFSK